MGFKNQEVVYTFYIKKDLNTRKKVGWQINIESRNNCHGCNSGCFGGAVISNVMAREEFSVFIHFIVFGF